MEFRFNSEQFTRYNHIPGEFGGPPFLGNVIESIKNIPGFQDKMQKKYGDVVKGYGLGKVSIMVFGHIAAEKFFYDKDNIMSTEQGFFTVYDFFPNGLLFRDFDVHTSHRRIMQTAFVPKALHNYTVTLNRRVRNYVDNFPKDTVVNYSPTLVQYLLQTASEVFMGIELEDQSKRIAEEFCYCIDGTMEPFRLNIPGTKFHRCKTARKIIEDFLSEKINVSRKTKKNDMFSLLCHAEDE